jgi:hypothetical protein
VAGGVPDQVKETRPEWSIWFPYRRKFGFCARFFISLCRNDLRCHAEVDSETRQGLVDRHVEPVQLGLAAREHLVVGGTGSRMAAVSGAYNCR